MPQSDSGTIDQTKDYMFDTFTQKELEVAEILLDISELMSMNKSSTSKSSSSPSRNPPARSRLKTYEDLQEEYAESIMQKEIFDKELQKLRSYHEQQKAFNSLLRKEAKSKRTVSEVDEVDLAPEKEKKIIKIKKCCATGKSKEG